MFMIYLHTKFHIPSLIGSLVIAMKTKTKFEIHAATMLFYSP